MQRPVLVGLAVAGSSFALGLFIASFDEVRNFEQTADWAALPTAIVGGLSGAVAAAVFAILSAQRMARSEILGDLRIRTEMAQTAQGLSERLRGFAMLLDSAGTVHDGLRIAIDREVDDFENALKIISVPLGSTGIHQGLRGIVEIHRWRPLPDMMNQASNEGAVVGAVVQLCRTIERALDQRVKRPGERLPAELELDLEQHWRWMWDMQGAVVIEESRPDNR